LNISCLLPQFWSSRAEILQKIIITLCSIDWYDVNEGSTSLLESRHRSLWSLQITIIWTEGSCWFFLQSGVEKLQAWPAADWNHNLRSLFSVRCLRPLSHVDPLKMSRSDGIWQSIETWSASCWFKVQTFYGQFGHPKMDLNSQCEKTIILLVPQNFFSLKISNQNIKRSCSNQLVWSLPWKTNKDLRLLHKKTRNELFTLIQKFFGFLKKKGNLGFHWTIFILSSPVSALASALSIHNHISLTFKESSCRYFLLFGATLNIFLFAILFFLKRNFPICKFSLRLQFYVTTYCHLPNSKLSFQYWFLVE